MADGSGNGRWDDNGGDEGNGSSVVIVAARAKIKRGEIKEGRK
jgi:hypothetical protein